MLADKRQLLGLGIMPGAGLMTAQAFAPNRCRGGSVHLGSPPDSAPQGHHHGAVPGAQGTKPVSSVAAPPDGFWLIEQKESGDSNSAYKYKDGRPLEQATDLRENAWLVDDKGAVKKIWW